MIRLHHGRGRRSVLEGFTLVELLLSMAVLAVLMMILVTITGQTSTVWRNTTGRVSQFREARNAFEAITRNLSQATLNTYYDYYNAGNQRRTAANASSFIPARYGRYSELRFQTGLTATMLGGNMVRPAYAVFFQAPLGYTNNQADVGLIGLMNTWGYYLEYRPDTDRPTFISGGAKYRCRLMEYMEPAEDLQVYADSTKWLDNVTSGGSNKGHVLASNIVFLSFLPKLPSKGPVDDPTVDPTGGKLAPSYAYDSETEGEGDEHPELNSFKQLPPIVEVTMVAIDEASAANLENGATFPAGLDTTDLFLNAGADQRRTDLKTLEGRLVAAKISYRIFRSDVSIRGAKWSREP